jgi:hypothetical protein
MRAFGSVLVDDALIDQAVEVTDGDVEHQGCRAGAAPLLRVRLREGARVVHFGGAFLAGPVRAAGYAKNIFHERHIDMGV